MKVNPVVAKALITVLGAIIVAMVGGGGVLGNALQGKANDKDRLIAILTAERDVWMEKAIEATLSARHARRPRRRRGEELSSPERERTLEKVEVGADLATQVRDEVKPDTFRAKPTFLQAPRPKRRVEAPTKR